MSRAKSSDPGVATAIMAEFTWRLPLKLRDPLMLARGSDLSIPQIARCLAIAESEVEKRVRVALYLVQRHVRKHVDLDALTLNLGMADRASVRYLM